MRVWPFFFEDLSEMRSFASTRSQMEAQKRDIRNYGKYLSKLSFENLEPRDSLFCGAGDSIACAIFAERLMNLEPRAVDPYDMLLYPEVLQGRKKAYFISISGRTRTNILAASLAKKKGLITTAITADPQSELAKVCSQVIELKFTRANELTPGTSSFTASLLAVSSLFKAPPELEVTNVIIEAKKWAKKYSDIVGNFHFVGSGAFYGIAVYAYAKIVEFAGKCASYQLTEEFSHMNLFSIDRKKDVVIIMSSGKEDRKAGNLESLLNAAGVRCVMLPLLEEEHVVNRAISYSIYSQYLALSHALNLGLSCPSFLKDKKILKVSDQMIY